MNTLIHTIIQQNTPDQIKGIKDTQPTWIRRNIMRCILWRWLFLYSFVLFYSKSFNIGWEPCRKNCYSLPLVYMWRSQNASENHLIIDLNCVNIHESLQRDRRFLTQWPHTLNQFSLILISFLHLSIDIILSCEQCSKSFGIHTWCEKLCSLACIVCTLRK